MSPDEEAPLVGGGAHGWTPLAVAPPLSDGTASLPLMERLKRWKAHAIILLSVIAVVLLLWPKSHHYSPSTKQASPIQDSLEGQDTMAKTNEALVLGQVIGDVIDAVSSPPVDLKVQYGTRKVSNGALLKPSETAAAPKVEIAGMVDSEIYTLVMVDPDAPSPSEPSAREWLHWLVVDIPGASSIPSAGTLVTEYNGPTPPIGIHRYVFVLFRQKGPLTITPPSTRKNFNMRQFAKQHGLGTPVAAVYFNAQKEGGHRRR